MFWGAGHYTVFDDEGFSCRRYAMPLGEMVSALWHGAEPDPPLYYILQNIWVHLFGVGPLGLRSLSIVMFLIGLVLIRQAGRSWFGGHTGLVAMAVCALHPAHLLFGLAGRWYSTLFCLVALLLCVTAHLRFQSTITGRSICAWALTAAAVCYTNYFGVAVVALTWLAAIGTRTDRRGWLKAAILFLILYAPWLPAFWRALYRFPQFGFSWDQWIRTGARVVMALTTGNLASVGTWWVWAPIGVSVLTFLITRPHRKRAAGLFLIVVGCLVAGVLSRTMIDKYVMAFSGPTCLLMAALFVEQRRNRRSWIRRVTVRISAAALAVAWLGCYFNLIIEQNWSSLRWLDPYEQVLAEMEGNSSSPPLTDWVISHPGARYYFGCMMARRAEPNGTIRPDVWRHFAEPPMPGAGALAQTAATPESMLERLGQSRPSRVLTIRGAEFADSPAWSMLQNALRGSYEPTWERGYLDDPDAEWKDELDPGFKHPKRRITVRNYQRRNGR